MLHLDHVSFSYADGVPVLENIDFKVAKGEHVSIIGESGCGKSTLLKIVYGLLHIEIGEVHWNNVQVMGPSYNLVPGEPNMKYLSQEFDLMPYTTVKENVGEFLSVFEPEEMQFRIQELLDMLQMTDFADTKVRHLSGGQQQRVALARVLAQEPEVLLLDEPFSHIDNFRKNQLRRNLFGYLKRKNITILTATHDPLDILPFADRIMVLRDRNIIATDTPKKLYEHPKDLYIASMFGEANKIPVNIVKSYADTKRRIIVYAHEFKVSDQSGLEVIVKEAFYMGHHYMIVAAYEGQDVYFHHHSPFDSGKVVFLNVSIETLNQRIPDILS
ncbi:ABC transporter ATP-binding protein [Pricia sp. S334]|uniref:ABC transporter ATP-binding protein n=1 Tax=Pricia mediterranea TaxID=3076079 RepID=A0ABU3L677_9FLAO|nr:ABC transporter ATP-binding protein [Pricia sp. S334]MDT7828743.1 ABC transporter ATP-binding protein [Pricia sp. S334]